NTPKRGISEITSHLTIDWSREHKQSVWEALLDDELLAQFGTAARNHIMAFTEMIGRYMELFKAMARPLDELFEELLVEMDYEAYVCRGCKTENEEQKRLISIGEMKTSLRNFASSGKALTDFLAQINLDQDDDDDDVEKKLGVCLITMHAAKGLEFPIVYLIGLEQGILPHKRSLEDGNCDEERRLLYVGITRAQELLTMTYCATRMRYGDRMPCVRSSFLDEIPNHLLTCESWEELMEKELTPEETADFFASLRSIIIDG
ncbi:MAG: ATP-dependent helicase, partial [Akkermansia sp.]